MLRPPRTSKIPRRTLVALGLWLVLACAAAASLLVYGNTPGRAGAAPARWPALAGLALVDAHPTLVMLAHPRCPCTRASLRELERLVAETNGGLRGYVLFTRPDGAPEGWERTDLWRTAEAIPGLCTAVDPDGAIARRLGAHTSGQVLVYDRTGELVFQGGLTAARGHEGASRGRDAIRRLVETGTPTEPETAVFGCPLASDGACHADPSEPGA